MSDVLSLVRMRSELVCANEYTAPFSLSFRTPVAHFHIVERGSAFLLVEGESAVPVESGDLVILPLGAGHILSRDRKSTRLNSSHEWISYAVFCLKKKKNE